ncbi:diguanylate cyclase, partial [Peptococcaceae bacterium]|nr:diguanylate cyclase [Peptococcaceae bacterium]
QKIALIFIIMLVSLVTISLVFLEQVTLKQFMEITEKQAQQPDVAWQVDVLKMDILLEYTLLIIVLMVICIILLMLFLNKVILNRLASIKTLAVNITASGNLAVRLPVTGNDELSDLTKEINKMLTSLEYQTTLFQQLFENSPAGIALMDNAQNILKINKSFTALFQYSAEEVVGKDINTLIAPKHLASETAALLAKFRQKKHYQKESLRQRKDGSEIHVSITSFPITLKENKIGIYLIYRDITKRKQLEEKLHYLSSYDTLTGLPNRNYFDQEMQRLESHDYYPVGIIVGDVDGLKIVNDTLGHSAGDELIKTAAIVLGKSLRKSDLVYRIGGDEFAILLSNTNEIAVKNACRRIDEAIYHHNDNKATPEFVLSISTGFAVSDKTFTGMNNLFKEADNNMYRAKKLRKSKKQ